MAGIQHATMNERVKKEYYRKATLFLKSELNGADKIGAVNTLTVPVITYGFNMINWRVSKIKILTQKPE